MNMVYPPNAVEVAIGGQAVDGDRVAGVR